MPRALRGSAVRARRPRLAEVRELLRRAVTPELESRLRDLLAKDYLVDPQVIVEVKEHLSRKVQVLGEAQRPGLFYLTGPTTLVQILSRAGGVTRGVHGRAAVGEERERLWQRWREYDERLDSWAARRPRETAVVVLEPIVRSE